MASRLFVNCKVFTGVGEEDFASAFRITDGVFTWVGDLAEVPGEGAVDLGGRTVVPGFLDVHTHPAMIATLGGAMNCLPPEVTSIRALIERLREHPGLGGDPKRWIEGFGYDESKYPEGRKPTARDLDEVSTDQPVLVRRCDGHSAMCNSRALKIAGIDANTPDPEHARFERDGTGEPNGVLTEPAAIDAVLAHQPLVGREERVRDLARLNEHFLSRGIVGVNDLLATVIPEPLETFRDAEKAGLLPQVGLYCGWADLARDGCADLTEEQRTGRVKIAGIKLFMDGTMSDRTAWTDASYPDSCSDHGIRVSSDDDLRTAVAWARRNGVQVAVHAMGDRALRHVVDMFADEDPWMGDRPSIRLDHATLFPPDLIDRVVAARMSFGVISHSIFLFAEYEAYRRNLSQDQFEIAYPIRSFYDRVEHTALASDNPATAWSDADNVFVSIKAAVLREAYNGADIGRQQSVTVPQAVLLYTGRAGRVSPLDHVGLIREGCEGSFVVLDRDVFAVDPRQIDQVQVAETWIRGEKAYRAI